MEIEDWRKSNDPIAIVTPNYVQVDDYTTFRAEYGLSHKGHFVMHFFATDEVKEMPDQQAREYWLNTFLQALEAAATRHMRYLEPKLFYIDEMVSWCIEVDQPAIPGAVLEFLEALDQSLDTLKST